jgi:nicotinamidase-related amidase
MEPDFVRRFREAYRAGESPRVGAGSRAAILVVDFIRGWTDAASPLAAPLDREVAATAALLRARPRDVPAVFTTVEYADGEERSNLLCRKAPRVALLRPGLPWTEIDPRLPRAAGDLVVTKQFASAFFGTDLAASLRRRAVDTLLICGCMTSGCVRATAVDAAQHGLHALVVRDGVGDRSALAHEANLMDIEARYGDVIALDEARAFLLDAGRAATIIDP